jgi:hypothetical protein
MPSPSAFNSLTPEQRSAFERELVRRNFADYDGLAAWLLENGFEISRSAAYRHGSKLKRKLQAVRNSTDAARMIAEAAPDDSDLRSAAVISLVQSELFDVMVCLQDLDEAEPAERVKLLTNASKAIRDMTLASISQKEFQHLTEERLRKEAQIAFAKLENEAASGANGRRKLDQATLKAVREEVYGLV